jgi:hypothetical protein
MTAEWD